MVTLRKASFYPRLFLVYYVLWIIPRISPLFANVLFADDFVHDPHWHLLSFRPLLYADLWFWNHFLGADYLMTATPKVLAGIYLSLTGLLTVDLLRRWGIPLMVAVAIPVFYISHPIINELSLWNVVAPYNLSLLLIVLGYWVLGDASSSVRVLSAVSFIALGISGYQIHAGLPPVLIIGEVLLKRLGGIPCSRAEIMRKIAVFATALVAYLVYVEVSRWLGYSSWGNRGLSSLWTASLPDYFSDKWHGISNMFANVFQSLISFYFGMETSWHAWKWVPIIVGLATMASGIYAGRSRTDIMLFSVTPVLLPGLATLVLLPLNVTPSGWRVCGPVLYAFCLALVPVLTLIMKSDDATAMERTLKKQVFSRTVIVMGIAVFWVVMTFPVVAYDGGLRVMGNKQELETLQSVESFWKNKGIERGGYAVAVYPINNVSLMKRYAGEKGRDIVINFNRIVSYDYSNLVNGFWPQFLMHYGYRPLDDIEEKDGIVRTLKEACEKEENGPDHVKSYLKVTHLETLNLSVICR